MAKRKREINFIESQKLAGKQNQSASFEFMLVVVVFVVAVVMVGWYVLSISKAKEAVTNKDNAAAELQSLKNQVTTNETAFAQYEVRKDANGNTIYSGKYKNGQPIPLYYSIQEVATAVANELTAAQNASSEVKGQIDLTTTVLNIVFQGAQIFDCNITKFTYTNSKVTLDVETTVSDSQTKYYRYMQGKSNEGLALQPTKYIGSVALVSGSEVNNGSETLYKFGITFTVINDALYTNKED